MKSDIQEFEVLVSLNFTEFVKARTVEEAIEKLEDKYIYGKGRLPREYIEVEEYTCDHYQVED
jgi:hypothetical protein